MLISGFRVWEKWSWNWKMYNPTANSSSARAWEQMFYETFSDILTFFPPRSYIVLCYTNTGVFYESVSSVSWLNKIKWIAEIYEKKWKWTLPSTLFYGVRIFFVSVNNLSTRNFVPTTDIGRDFWRSSWCIEEDIFFSNFSF